ncbi:MAG TPA: universal stress protein [Gaiellaceae bacterium]|nr:universal stress protein [Gaiellaceae bacterium]
MKNAPILICYDDTSGSRRAIAAAAELLGPRRAVVVDVFPVMTPEESKTLTTTGAPGASFGNVNEEAALEQASIGAAHAREAGFEAEAYAALGGPTWKAITQIADEIDAAVIVIGSRGFTGLREAVEGSVSHMVAEHAHRPVLIVPPGLT